MKTKKEEEKLYEVRTINWTKEKKELFTAYDMYEDIVYEWDTTEELSNLYDQLLEKTNRFQAETFLAIAKFSTIEVIRHFYEEGIVYGSDKYISYSMTKTEEYPIECNICIDYRFMREQQEIRKEAGLKWG